MIYLNYGPYSSYAPHYDSTFANISKDDSDLIYSAYGEDSDLPSDFRWVTGWPVSSMPHSPETPTDLWISRGCGPNRRGNPGDSWDTCKSCGEATSLIVFLREEAKGRSKSGTKPWSLRLRESCFYLKVAPRAFHFTVFLMLFSWLEAIKVSLVNL